MSTKAVVPRGPQIPVPMSMAARFVGIFFSTRSTFSDIARRPDFRYPLMALVVSSVAVTETMRVEIGMDRMIRASLQQSGQAARMSAEQMEQAIEGGAKIATVLAHVGGLLGPPIIVLLFALLSLVILNGVFGAAVKFNPAFSLTCYANLPRLLAALMGFALILSGDPSRFNPQNPLPSNLGFFLDPEAASKPLYVLASSIDLFTVWVLALLGMGLSEATGRKVNALSIFLSYFGLWMVWVLGRVGLAMLLG